jgi:hypothetical protein
MTYYGRWTYKFEEAARQGAIGFLVIHETRAGLLRLGDGEELQHQRDLRHRPQEPPRGASPAGGLDPARHAVDLFKKAGLDFEALKKQAQPATSSRWRSPARPSPDYDVKADEGHRLHNVVGRCPGRRTRTRRV